RPLTTEAYTTPGRFGSAATEITPPGNRRNTLPRVAGVVALEEATTPSSGINRLRSGCVHGERVHDEIGETGVDGGPSRPTINGFSDATCNRAHENSSGAVRVHSDGLDESGAGANVGPRAGVLLGHQEEWRKEHTHNDRFHIVLLIAFRLLGEARKGGTQDPEQLESWKSRALPWEYGIVLDVDAQAST